MIEEQTRGKFAQSVWKLLRKYGNWNWNWNLDAALRYEPAVKIIKEMQPDRVVEIGSGSRGISTYAKYPSIGIDVNFDNNVVDKLQRRIIVTDDHYPFDDDSIDLVVATDMLEHVVPSQRPTVIKEIFRIAKESGIVYISVPAGIDAANADKRLHKEFIARRGKPHPMLSDHVKNGLPDKEEILELIQTEAGKRDWQLNVKENTPIIVWEWNLLLFGVDRWLPGLRHVQRLIVRPLFPLLKRIRSKANYRLIITASKKPVSYK